MAVCGSNKTVRRSATTTTISANKNLTVSSGTGKWRLKRSPSADLTEGAIASTDSSLLNLPVRNLKTVGTYVYVWRISSGTCFSEDSLKVFKKSSVVSNRQKATPKL